MKNPKKKSRSLLLSSAMALCSLVMLITTLLTPNVAYAWDCITIWDMPYEPWCDHHPQSDQQCYYDAYNVIGGWENWHSTLTVGSQCVCQACED